jgi:hypothetical protein
MGKSQHGHSCSVHKCCGTALLHVGSYVCFSKTGFVWRDGKEEDILKVYFLRTVCARARLDPWASILLFVPTATIIFGLAYLRFTSAIVNFATMSQSARNIIVMLGVA